MRIGRWHASYLLGLLLCFTSGCLANRIKVIVERIDMESTPSPLAHPSTTALCSAYVDNLEMLSYLDGFASNVASDYVSAINKRRVSQGKGELEESKAANIANVIQEELNPAVNSLTQRASELKKRGEQLRDKNQKLFGKLPDEVSGDAPSTSPTLDRPWQIHVHKCDVHAYVAEVHHLASEATRTLEPKLEDYDHRIAKTLKKHVEEEAQSDLERLPRAPVEKFQEISERSSEYRSSFGGFMVTGVYMISPADPEYHKVLKLKGIPFAEASVDASGDTTAIIVFDDPVRPRTYQVQNDPSQLIRNVVNVIDQAVQAVAKYATVPG